MLVLSGDIGGTHTRVQFTEFTASNAMKVIAIARYNNNEHSSFIDIVDDFFIEAKIERSEIVSACFGAAGPVINGKVNVTNLPWIIDTNDLKQALKIDKVEVINDFMAIGYGIEVLKPENLLTLQAGKPQEDGIKAYIGAGTGLGVGFMTYHQGTCLFHSTEGGHVDFAPTDDMQFVKVLAQEISSSFI